MRRSGAEEAGGSDLTWIPSGRGMPRPSGTARKYGGGWARFLLRNAATGYAREKSAGAGSKPAPAEQRARRRRKGLDPSAPAGLCFDLENRRIGRALLNLPSRARVRATTTGAKYCVRQNLSNTRITVYVEITLNQYVLIMLFRESINWCL